MRRIFLTLPILVLFIAPTAAIALTGDAARSDWSLGQPNVIANNTTTCNNQATARFDWSLGQPAVVYDATATCTAAVASTGDSGKSVRIDGGASVQFGGGASTVIP